MTHDELVYIGSVFMGFLAIMNPLANTPVFLALTADDDASTRKAVARKALLAAFLIVVVFSVAGRLIFDLFGITLPAFRITGGILVFGIGYSMLHGGASKSHSPTEPSEGADRESRLSVAISPLAVPILAGPGTIATAMSFVAHGSAVHVAITVASFAVLCLISYVFFVSGEELIRFLGANAIGAVTRMMGLILAVIGVQMFLDGATAVVKTFQ
jgi:multiple antibiotic resistance protein